MKNQITLFIIAILLLLPFNKITAYDHNLIERLSGRILLQVESYGRAWYLYPGDKTRYYLRDGNEAFNIMRNLGLGITNQDLEKIPINYSDQKDYSIINRVKGKILLQVENNGEAWYVDPNTSYRHYLKNGEVAYDLMRNLSLGINNEDLRKIPMNDTQLAFDAAFDNVAYTVYENHSFSNNYNSTQILPLASLTKLMTALVLLEQDIDFNSIITINSEHINYPHYYVGNDITSEIKLTIGDKIRTEDLWVAMLVASSNQATAALVDSTGLTNQEFVAKMNDKAQMMGLAKTVFLDVAGLDAHNISTPQETAMMAWVAFSKPKIAQTSKIEEYMITASNINNENIEIDVINRNYSLLKYKPDAVKTGFLVEAQRNVTLLKDNKIIVIMHARSMSERNNIIENILEIAEN